ncbi:MAG TPA: PGF-pre-PGF domain-containing protein, partial [Methanocorpusculum sp.]|nr:PGF-pre-PGF domain-containing protein [Methanocorpusculum sp.]
VTFSKVYDITSTDPNVKLTQVTVTVPKADVAASGLTTDDVTIYHNMVTYDIWVPLDTLQITEDAVNYYYTAATDGTSPFGVLIKRFDDSPAVPTTKPTTRPTQSSPAPILGLIAGLAVAATVVYRLRKE